MTSIMATDTTYTHRVNGGSFHLVGTFGATRGEEYVMRNTRTGVEFHVSDRALRTDFRKN